MKLLILILLFGLLACSVGPGLPELPKRSDLPVAARIDALWEDILTEPENAEYNGRLGLLLHRYNDILHAEIFYRRAYLLAPGEFRWQYYLARALASLDRHDEATATLRRALATGSGYAPARLQLAILTFGMENFVECEQHSRELLNDPESAPHGHYWLGRIAERHRQIEEAARHYDEALEGFAAFGAAHLRRGLLASAQGEAELARKHLIAADRYKYATPPVRDTLLAEALPEGHSVTELLARGYAHERAGRPEEALAAYQAAVRLDPRSDDAHARLIGVHAEAGRAPQAVEHYRTAKTLNPEQADAYANFGLLRLNEQRFQEAAAAFEQALRLNPYHPEALASNALLLERNRGWEAAEEMYRKAVECRPGFRDAHLGLGRVLIHEQRYEAAFEQLEAVVRDEDERTPRLLLELSRLYTIAGNPARARESVRRAHELAGEYGQAGLLDEIESRKNR